VQQPAAGQLLHDRGDTARIEQLLHVEGTARAQVGDERRLTREAIEQLERQLDAASAGNGREVDDGVCRAAQGHH